MSADRLVVLLNKLEELGVSLVETAKELKEATLVLPREMLKEMIEMHRLLDVIACKSQVAPKKKRKPRGTGIKRNIHQPDQ